MAVQMKSVERKISATEMRRNFGAVVRSLRQGREHAIIQTGGQPVAVLLSIAEYERLMGCDRLAVFNEFARNLGEEVETRGLSEEEVLADFEETRREVAEAQYGRPA